MQRTVADYTNKVPPNAVYYYGGNKCGHVPVAPQFYQPPPEHKQMSVLYWASQALQTFYHGPQTKLRRLCDQRASTRQMRSERREGVAAVLGVLLHYTELASLRVGVPLDNGLLHPFLTLQGIAKRVGWRTDEDDELDRARHARGQAPMHRGVKRVYRAIAVLKAAGYLTVHPRAEPLRHVDTPGSTTSSETWLTMAYRGLPAVYCLTTAVFQDLGISMNQLEKARQRAAKRLKAKTQAWVTKIEKTLEKGQYKTRVALQQAITQLTRPIGTPSQTKRQQQQANAKLAQRIQAMYSLEELDRQRAILAFWDKPEHQHLSLKAATALYHQQE